MRHAAIIVAAISTTGGALLCASGASFVVGDDIGLTLVERYGVLGLLTLVTVGVGGVMCKAVWGLIDAVHEQTVAIGVNTEAVRAIPKGIEALSDQVRDTQTSILHELDIRLPVRGK